MITVSVHKAKTHLSRLIKRVLAGEEVTVTRNKEPVIRLVRAEPPPAPRPSRIGTMKGRLGPVDDSFFEPLSEEELAAGRARRFEGPAGQSHAVMDVERRSPALAQGGGVA